MYSVLTFINVKLVYFLQESEENKLIYTEIFGIYTAEIENFIEAELSKVYDHKQVDFYHLFLEGPKFLNGNISETIKRKTNRIGRRYF